MAGTMQKAGAARGIASYAPAIVKRLLPGVMTNRKVRLTAAGWLYNGLVFLFGLAAINTGNNLLYLILAVMIGLMLASFWLSEMTITELNLCRELPEAVYAGEDFIIGYRLKNLRSFWPAAAVEILEQVDGRASGGFFGVVRAGFEEKSCGHAQVSRRGRFEFNEFLVRTRFPFGFFEKTKKARQRDSLVVLPRLGAAGLESAPSGGQSGMIRPGQKGPGSELFGFREYIPGDHPHWIDWKASARSRQILVQETERESEQSVIIELGVSRERPTPDSESREMLIRKGFGLAKNYLDQGWRVRVEISGRGVEFGAGPSQLRSIGYFLALFDDHFEPLTGAQLSPSPFQARKVVVE